jgi:hypothetical protein
VAPETPEAGIDDKQNAARNFYLAEEDLHEIPRYWASAFLVMAWLRLRDSDSEMRE